MKPKRSNLNTVQLYSCFSIFVFSSYMITHLILNSSQISGTPTVKPYDKFDAEKDVEKIHKLGEKNDLSRKPPDVNTIVRMICHRDSEQRTIMKHLFWEKYKQPIAQYCAFTTGGEASFKNLVDDCFHSELEIYREHLHWELTDILKKLDKEAIFEILLSISPEKKQEFLTSYNETFKITLEKEAGPNTQGDFKNLLQEMIKRNRGIDIPPEKIDWEKANREAQIIHDGRKKWDNHRCDLDRILMETPIQQLNTTFVEFKKINGKELEEVLQKHMEKDKRGCYKAIVFFVKDKHNYYAKRLEKAMEGWGTQDHVINRIVTIHSETDLEEIATAFKLNTGGSLIDALAKDTVGHHEKLLTCLAGKPLLKENF